MEKTTLIHLSHTDMDGYGCQWFTAKQYDYIGFNADYGDDLQEKLGIIIDLMENNETTQLLITDLNLTMPQAVALDKFDGRVHVLDHHISGEDVAVEFDWYHLDTTKSGTLLTAEYLNIPADGQAFPLINAINAGDIFIKDPISTFRLGRVVSSITIETRELLKGRVSPDTMRKVIIELYDIINRAICEYEGSKEDVPVYIDEGRVTYQKDAIYNIGIGLANRPNQYTREELISALMLREYTEASDIASVKPQYIVEVQRIISSEQPLKCMVTYNVQGISDAADFILSTANNIDFILNISERGTIRLRARQGGVDVNAIATSLFNGGGHQAAAGGKIEVTPQSYDEAYNVISDCFATFMTS